MNPLIPDSILKIVEKQDTFTLRISQEEASSWIQKILDHISFLFGPDYIVLVFWGALAVTIRVKSEQSRFDTPFPILVLHYVPGTSDFIFRISDLCYLFYLHPPMPVTGSKSWLLKRGDDLIHEAQTRSLSALGIFTSALAGARMTAHYRAEYVIPSLFNLSALEDLKDQGLLQQKYAQKNSVYRDKDISILNYTRKATYENALKNHPNAALLRQCRGVVVGRNLIYTLPWSKFFNYGEPGCPNIPATVPLITKKYDGSLGILFTLDEKTYWTTRGDLESPQAKVAQTLWGDRPSSVIPFGWSIMAEIIHPSTKVIVDYNFEGLVVLGARNIISGDEIPYEEVADWAANQNLRMTERIEGSFEEALQMVAEMDAQQEGFVLAWPPEDGKGEWIRVKVKSKDYLRVHRILSNLSDFRIGSLWYFQKLHEIPIDIPEEFSMEINRIREELEKSSFQIEREIKDAFTRTTAAAGVGPSAKVFSSVAKEIAGEWFSAVMNQFRSKPNDVRLLAFKKRFERSPSED